MKSYLRIVLLVVVVSLAGCASLSPAADPSTTTPEPSVTDSPTQTDESTPEPTATETATEAVTETGTAASETETPNSDWSAPENPNLPFENKIDEERVPDVELINIERGPNGEGYANFDLEVTADTRMGDIDPADHGTVAGEPYLMIYVNGTQFARTEVLPMRDNGTFTVQINEQGLMQFEPGEVEIKVRLIDRDSEWDDIYGSWRTTINYQPE